MSNLLSQEHYNYLISFNSYESYAIDWASRNPSSDATMLLLIDLLKRYIKVIKPTCLNDYILWLKQEKGLVIEALNLSTSAIALMANDIEIYNNNLINAVNSDFVNKSDASYVD